MYYFSVKRTEATDLPASGATAKAWNAEQWLNQTMPMWKRLVNPVAEHMNRAQLDTMPEQAREMMGPMAGMLNQMNAMQFGMKLGHALGDLAQQALTGTDFGLPVAPAGTAAVLPRNIAEISKGLNLPGQEVMVNEAMNIVKVLGFEKAGEIVTLKETLEDGRLLISTSNDEERVVRLAEPLRHETLRAGDSLLLDGRAGYVYEKVPKSEVEELVLEEVPDVDYSDIGGLGRQIELIRDAVELPFLHADLFREYQLRPPKGILLYGPPGCGKTLIAKAVAASLARKVAQRTGQDSATAYFLNIKGPELLNKYVGETERHIRLIFQRAREKASEGTPVIVFFDEMDSIFRTRGSGVSSDVETTIVPQLLAEIDGVESLGNVIVIGASNREDLIDPAILRPGRLDVKVRIDRPDRAGAADGVLRDGVELTGGATRLERLPHQLQGAGDDQAGDPHRPQLLVALAREPLAAPQHVRPDRRWGRAPP